MAETSPTTHGAEGSEPAASSTSDEIGELRFPERYHVTGAIGIGGLARVYRAQDAVLGRSVALKMFRASATAEQELARQRAEIVVLANLSHPNLVALHDAAIDRSDPDNPRIYYVMELVEGTDLKRLLDREQLGARQIAQLGYFVATALDHVHHHGIVHRDVKPANILLGDLDRDAAQPTVKLGDFGLASVGSVSSINQNEPVSGTVAYLSPEQAQGELVAAPSDIYSLGLVLLQCFTRRLAFPGTPVESALARLLDDPAIDDEVPADWRALLTAMTARRPADRPDARDVALALRQMFVAESGRHRAGEGGDEPDLADIREALAPMRGSLDRVTMLAARVLQAPIALITLLDDEEAWIAARVGTGAVHPARGGRELAAIIRSGPIAVAADWLVQNQLPVTADGAPPFCAGVALMTRTGRVLGALCVIGGMPRVMSGTERANLTDLAALIMSDFELRVAAHRSALARSDGAGADPVGFGAGG